MPSMKRINLDDPKQMAQALRSGFIWKSPQHWQIAVNAISSGLVPLAECKNVPAEVLRELTGEATR